MNRLGPAAFLAAVALATLAINAGPALASYTSTYMGFTVPERGDPGPTYADNIEAAFVEIDLHDHTTGKGTTVPSAGININADLTFKGRNATRLNTVRFDTTAVTIGASDRRAAYQCSGELCWVDEAGNITTITNDGSVNATPGSITGMTGSAGVAYSSVTDTFSFTDETGVPAAGSFGCVRIAEEVSGGKGPVLCSDPATAADFNVFFPTGLPGSNRGLCLDASGNISTCTATAAVEALTVAASTSSATMSTTGDGAIGDDLVVYDTLDVANGATGTASTYGGETRAADATANNTTSPSSVGNLTWDVATVGSSLGTDSYYLSCDFLVSAAADTTGVRIGVDIPSGTINAHCQTTGAASGFIRAGFASDDGACSFAESDGTSQHQYTLAATIDGPATGNVTVRLRSEVGTSNVTIHSGLCTLVEVNL